MVTSEGPSEACCICPPLKAFQGERRGLLPRARRVSISWLRLRGAGPEATPKPILWVMVFGFDLTWSRTFTQMRHVVEYEAGFLQLARGSSLKSINGQMGTQHGSNLLKRPKRSLRVGQQVPQPTAERVRKGSQLAIFLRLASNLSVAPSVSTASAVH